MSDTTINGNGKKTISSAFLVIKDIILIVALFGAMTLFIDIKVSLSVLEKTVQELVDLHPRIQGGTR